MMKETVMADLRTNLCRKFCVRPAEAQGWIDRPETAPRLAKQMIGNFAPAIEPAPVEEAAPVAAVDPLADQAGAAGGDDDSGV